LSAFSPPEKTSPVLSEMNIPAIYYEKTTKTDTKSKKEIELARPKRKYVKKTDIVKGIRIDNTPVLVSFT
jgi:hypothetical protein